MVAIDAHDPDFLVAGSNDYIDQQACPQDIATRSATCDDFSAGIGVTGLYFSFDRGKSWIQPAYTGWQARDCGTATVCAGSLGPIGRIPWYYEAGLIDERFDEPWSAGVRRDDVTVPRGHDVPMIGQRPRNDLRIGGWRDRIETTGEQQHGLVAHHGAREILGQRRAGPTLAGRQIALRERGRSQASPERRNFVRFHARGVFGANHRVMQGEIHGSIEIFREHHCGREQWGEVSAGGAIEDRRYEARKLWRVDEGLQSAYHEVV